MGIFGIGTDIVKVSRIKKLIINKKFLKRLFNKEKLKNAVNQKIPPVVMQKDLQLKRLFQSSRYRNIKRT